ncbi:hypothetical protein FBY30_2768 [Arthrobacter sp. SLBN-83]|uniref:hypothetical protein n=1 Tax=Arthrobacter sp. SLBN-83 TaxID=2768449 RepID=UPI00114F8CD8|nr:hypothetical protein [Arthrobacter sp. SLBN-83]TQJ60500.1 hypothetical protein FBY30_2768 [Arthrobacter sp. SLBN-83]
MNARDELAALAREAIYKPAASSLVTHDIADAILAAGYRKPRTITTAEELDALPVGSVVLRNGRAFQRFAPHRVNAFYEYKAWQCTDGGFVRSTKDGMSILPATVIHEADPS